MTVTTPGKLGTHGRWRRASWGAFIALSLVGCGNKEELQRIQHDADERVAKAQKEASDRVAAAQKELEAAKAQFAEAAAKAKAEADQALESAKASAEEQEKDAAAALSKAREAYKAEGRAKLKDLNEDVNSLGQKAATAPQKAKTAVNDAMKEISKLEAQISKDISAFDQATVDTFRTVRAKLDQDLAKLKAKIQAARSKL